MNISIMKIQYKLGLMALGLVAFSSCEKHDPIADAFEIGPEVPTAYWEVGSTTCKAGDSLSIKGQYYSAVDQTPVRSEVWYSINQDDEAAATLKLAGTAYSYTQTVTSSTELRPAQVMATFDHSLAVWDGYEFVINGKVPTSTTLAPVSWNPAVWDQENFDRYYPAEFADSFINVVTGNLILPSYAAAMKNVYVNYAGYTNEYMDSINKEFNVAFPTDVEPGKKGKAKSDYWHYITDATGQSVRFAGVIGYYNIAGTRVEVSEVPDSVRSNLEPNLITWQGETWYSIYEASPWLYCRYDNESATIVTSIIDEYIPAVQKMLSKVTFDEWVYNSTDQNYAVSFNRKFKLKASFKVIDTAGNVGKAYNEYDIDIN